MSSNPLPSETARDALIQLARRRLPPTPENYAAVYYELGGVRPVVNHPAAQALRGYAAALADGGSDGGRAGRQLERAMAREDWESAGTQLIGLARSGARPHWAPLVREVLKGLETRHTSMTLARKRESIEHVLSAFAEDDDRAHGALEGLVKAWGAGVPQPDHGSAPLASVSLAPVPPARSSAAAFVPASLARPEATDEGGADLLRDLLAGTLEFMTRPSEGGESPDAAIVQRAREARDEEHLKSLEKAVRTLWLRWDMLGSERDEVRNGLQSLLRLLVDNAGELVEDDRWLRGQTEAVSAMLQEPLTRKKLKETERALRGVLYKQSARKFSLDQAKKALKDMVSSYVTNLEDLGRDTGLYHERIREHRRVIEATQEMGDLREAVTALLEDTRSLQADVLRRRDTLEAKRLEASGHERRIRELEGQLETLSATARQDPLTGLLNRRGFDDAFAVEAARADRDGEAPLTVVLLDVDNFKRLNDAHGHQVGDRALEHLADVVRASLRPTDVVARYGGEEFVIVMAGTRENDAGIIVSRVQRELTRRFFLANNEKVFVTFSAGVAERRAGESREDLVDRADRALYEAKRLGKNRVQVAASAGGG